MSVAARKAKKARREQLQRERHYYLNWDDRDFDCDDSHVDNDCWKCGGEGAMTGEEINDIDPFWYDADEVYDCPCCHGSGKAEDCTYW